MNRNGASRRCRKPHRKQSKPAAVAPAPLAQQYERLKRQAAGALLLFHLAEYYVLFYEDAITAARELEMPFTQRNEKRGEGVPILTLSRNAADLHLTHLLQRGYRLAICDQPEACSAPRVRPGTATERGVEPSLPSVVCISRPASASVRI